MSRMEAVHSSGRHDEADAGDDASVASAPVRPADTQPPLPVRSGPYVAEVVANVALFADEIRKLGSRGVGTPFQTIDWLKTWYDVIAASFGCTPLPIRVRDQVTGEVAALVPLVIRDADGLRVISFADLGVTDYNAPLLGPASPTTAAGHAAFLAAVRRALPPHDLIRLEKQPIDLEGLPNPLANVPAATVSPLFGNPILVRASADEFVRERGRKYRKEIGRCFRVLETRGQRGFRRARTRDEALQMLRILEEQQRTRILEAGKPYILDHPAIAAFYERVLLDGLETGFASIFCLSADDTPVAMLFGVQCGTTFLLLRISNAGEAWKNCSPGRLIVVETMRELREEGISTFDMTIGDYAFKRGFGPEPMPLADTTIAGSWRGWASVLSARAKSAVRASPRLHGLVRRIRGHTTPGA